jgi:1,3-beta-glucanosyltransferase GAS5
MKLLADNGIYLILDVNTPKLSLNREYPKETYNDVYLQHVFATMDVMSKYENTLGFFAANEVLNDE